MWKMLMQVQICISGMGDRNLAPAKSLHYTFGESSNYAETRLRTGAPGEIRTPDHLVRSQALYPTELRAHMLFKNSEVYRSVVLTKPGGESGI